MRKKKKNKDVICYNLSKCSFNYCQKDFLQVFILLSYKNTDNKKCPFLTKGKDFVNYSWLWQVTYSVTGLMRNFH